MSFFKDFKDDLSLAVNELLPGEDFEMEEELEESPEMMVNTLEGDLDIESELSKLDGLLEHVDKEKQEPVKHVQIEPEEPVLEKSAEKKPAPVAAPKPQPAPKPQEPEKKPEPVRAAEKEESIQAAISRFDTILEPEKQEEEDDDLPFDFDALLKEAEEKPKQAQPKPQPVQPNRSRGRHSLKFRQQSRKNKAITVISIIRNQVQQSRRKYQ